MFEVGEKEGVILPTSCWEALENACLMHRPDVVMVDPLVAINAVPENDNQLIRRVMTVLKIGLTQRFNCALVIAHHDLKAGGSNEDFDQTNARGAGDIVNAVRFEFAVKKMSVQQAGAMNVQEDRRGFYFRLGSPGSKVNYDEPLGSAWFERKAVPIAGESTVYCVPWEPPVGTLDEAQTAELIEAIGKGSSYGPYSPQLGKGDRSLSPVLKRLDIHSRTAQRRVLLGLRDSGAVEVVAFKRGGHGSEIRKGLRTPDGEPHNYEWQDEAEDDLL